MGIVPRRRLFESFSRAFRAVCHFFGEAEGGEWKGKGGCICRAIRSKRYCNETVSSWSLCCCISSDETHQSLFICICVSERLSSRSKNN
jgi:hypothetical protein